MNRELDIVTIGYALDAYIECALWSTSSVDENGNDLENLDSYAVSSDTRKAMERELVRFLESAVEQGLIDDDTDLFQVAHDFWLTRNRHGAGFWDRPHIYGAERARKLTDWAHAFGSVDLYIGEDGKVHQ